MLVLERLLDRLADGQSSSGPETGAVESSRLKLVEREDNSLDVRQPEADSPTIGAFWQQQFDLIIDAFTEQPGADKSGFGR